MKIKYAVWEYVKEGRKKKTKVTTGILDWEGNFDNDDHYGLRSDIRKAHPGQHIMGYAPMEKWDEFTMSINEANVGLNLR